MEWPWTSVWEDINLWFNSGRTSTQSLKITEEKGQVCCNHIIRLRVKEKLVTLKLLTLVQSWGLLSFLIILDVR